MFKYASSKTASGWALAVLRAWVGAAAAALLTGSAFAQDIDYSHFQRSTLNALNANLAASVEKKDREIPHKVGDNFFDAGLAPWVVEATYAGAARRMNDDEKAVVHTSFKAFEQEPLAALYEQSTLFRVNGKDYWLPVQSAVLPYFAKELKAGDKIDLYLLQSGGVLQKNGWEWLFLVVDFKKTQGNAAGGNP